MTIRPTSLSTVSFLLFSDKQNPIGKWLQQLSGPRSLIYRYLNTSARLPVYKLTSFWIFSPELSSCFVSIGRVYNAPLRFYNENTGGAGPIFLWRTQGCSFFLTFLLLFSLHTFSFLISKICKLPAHLSSFTNLRLTFSDTLYSLVINVIKYMKLPTLMFLLFLWLWMHSCLRKKSPKYLTP